jgi:hypothetical protein
MQRKLGNIVDDNEKTIYDDIFNKVSSYNDIDTSLPTLVVGIELAREIIPDFSILHRGDGDLFWTFTKRERRSENADDLAKFKRLCVRRYADTFRYDYVSFTCYPYSRMKKFINYINGDDNKMCFVTKDSRFVFIFSSRYKVVWGLSLSLCDYINVDKKKVLQRLRSNPNNHFVNGVSFADPDIRNIIGDDTHLIPPLLCYFAKK